LKDRRRGLGGLISTSEERMDKDSDAFPSVRLGKNPFEEVARAQSPGSCRWLILLPKLSPGARLVSWRRKTKENETYLIEAHIQQVLHALEPTP